MHDHFFSYLIEHLKKNNFKEVALKTKKNHEKYGHIAQFWNLRGIALDNLGLSNESLKCFFKCHELDSNNPGPLHNISKIYFKNKNYQKSIEFSNKALQLKKDYLPAWLNLMNSHLMLEQYQKCIDIADRLLENFSQQVDLAYIHNLKGSCYECLQENNIALENYNIAIKHNANFVPALLNIANYYSNLGEIDIAKKKYLSLIESNPALADVHRRLSIITKYKDENDPHIQQMQEIFEQHKNDHNKVEELGYALSKGKEDVKNYKDAHHYFSISNSIRDKKTNYNFKFQEEEFAVITKIFETIKKQKDSGLIKENNAIFILGMPRSGTTLIEQIISSHPQVQGLEEIDYLSKSMNLCVEHKSLDEFYQKIIENSDNIFDCIHKKYFERINLKKNSNFSHHTDKMPVNYKLIGFIKNAIPNAKIIHCVRDPRDVFVSILKNYFGKLQMSYAYNSKKLTHALNLYVDYMTFWKKLYGDWIYDLKYENLVVNSEQEITKLLQFCNLSFDKSCLDFQNNKKSVSTASTFQVRQPIYKSSSAAWKNYENFLADDFKNLKFY